MPSLCVLIAYPTFVLEMGFRMSRRMLALQQVEYFHNPRDWESARLFTPKHYKKKYLSQELAVLPYPSCAVLAVCHTSQRDTRVINPWKFVFLKFKACIFGEFLQIWIDRQSYVSGSQQCSQQWLRTLRSYALSVQTIQVLLIKSVKSIKSIR